jgi:hypothetical protein
MQRAYYALTDVGPYRAYQVVLLDEQDGWTRTGYLRELKDPAPAQSPAEPILIPVRM